MKILFTIKLIFLFVGVFLFSASGLTAAITPTSLAEFSSPGLASGVSCSPDGYCVAVGSYRNAAGYDVPLVMLRAGGLWQIDTAITPPGNAPWGNLTNVSCVNAQYCVAIGAYRAAGSVRDTPWVVVKDSQGWATLSSPAASGTLSAVSCISDLFCLVGGSSTISDYKSQAYLLLVRGRAAEMNHTLNNQLTNISQIGDIDCSASGLCTIAASKIRTGTIQNPTQPVLMTYRQNVIEGIKVLGQQDGQAQRLSCTDVCTAMLKQGNQQQYFSESVGSYASMQQVAGGLLNAVYADIDCVTSDWCMTVGRADDTDANYLPIPRGVSGLIDGEPRQDWRVEPSHASQSLLKGVSCTSSSFCVAVGLFVRPGSRDSFPYVAEYDGANWHTIQHYLEISSSEQNSAPLMVAFGDSVTTGFSIPDCISDRMASPWGCAGYPSVVPYPDRVAGALGYRYADSPANYMQTSLRRVGIWGYTAQESAREDESGTAGGWQPQLQAIEEAQHLVVGSLGINDLQFSDVLFWAKQYYALSGSRVNQAAQSRLAALDGAFDAVFSSLGKARANGAQVVIVPYYNPFDSNQQRCGDLQDIGATIVGALNNELSHRAETIQAQVADVPTRFSGHGAGTIDAYVFGTECTVRAAIARWLPTWLGGGGGETAVAAAFDPHPNAKGTEAIAQSILKEIQQ